MHQPHPEVDASGVRIEARFRGASAPLIDFLLKLRHDFRMLAEDFPEPCERDRGGFMARINQGDDFILELAIAKGMRV